MQFREQFLTYGLVTVVAVLIWYWAAAETRDQKPASFRLQLVPSSADQIVKPREISVTVEMEGSKLALKRASDLDDEAPLVLTVGNELPAHIGIHRANLMEVLKKNDALTKTGIGILSVDPAIKDIEIDAVVPVAAQIEAMMPGVEPEGNFELDPPQVMVFMPSKLRDRAGEDLVIEAHPLQTGLDRLKPGTFYELDARLRLPSHLVGERSVRIEPPTAKVKFTVKSRIKETTVPTVRVQLAGPAKDNDEFVIEIENKTLTDVTIKANGELIRAIERGDAVVVALLHLSHKEKDQGIESKSVTCFMALPTGETSSVIATLVDAEVAGSGNLPVIGLQITARTSAKP